MKEPDQEGYDRWLAWTQRTQVPQSVFRQQPYRKPAGQRKNKGFLHGCKQPVKTPYDNMKECEKLQAELERLEAQLAKLNGG